MKAKNPMNEYPLLEAEQGNIPLFYPHIPEKAIENVTDVLSTRWIGQGPKVDLFEERFSNLFNSESKSFVAVNSGTSALHLSYLLAGIGPGDEVLCPVFTCTATNLALIYVGATLKFYDVKDGGLNASVEDIESLVSEKTKAIVTVDYGGLPNDYNALRKIADKYDITIIADLAHCFDGSIGQKSILEFVDYAICSFQAIKTLTTGDGGMLICPKFMEAKAKRLRWFGIDRTEKQKGTWENDITEVGYKYQMTDISAAIGLAGLEELESNLKHRRMLLDRYNEKIDGFGLPALLESKKPYGADFTPWLATYICEGGLRIKVMDALRDAGVESAQVHYRNDRYTVFSPWSGRTYINMDTIEDNYLVLPLHTKMSIKDVDRVVAVLASEYSLNK